MGRPGLPSKSDYVFATSTREGFRQKTAHTMLYSGNQEEVDLAWAFHRKLWALLVMQFSAILFLTSPFGLIETIKAAIEPFHTPLQIIAIAGITGSICLALVKGRQYPYAHVCLGLVTFFVAFELGILFAHYSWGKLGLVALGQATTSFAIILALVQFEMNWLGYVEAGICCLGIAILWMIVLFEEGGTRLFVCAAVGLGGWAFAIVVLAASYQVTKYVSPDEYVLGVLFILKPAAVVFLSSKERQPAGTDEEIGLVV